MGELKNHLLDLIAKQVNEKGIVVWYDPEFAYNRVIEELNLPETTLMRFEDSYMKLRREIEPYLEFLDESGKIKPDCNLPPRLIVYVPKDRSDTRNALIEAETAGTIMEPGADSRLRNTRLRVLAEHVFSKIAPEQAQDLSKQVEKGLLSFEELDKLSLEIEAMGSATLKLIFGTTAVVDVALMLVSSDKYDPQIAEKQAVEELKAFFQKEIGIDFTTEISPVDVRQLLQRYLLTGEMITALDEKIRPDAVKSLPIPREENHIKTVGSICNLWRNRLDYRESFVQAAKSTESELNLDGLEWPRDFPEDLETFPVIEKRLLLAAENDIINGNIQRAMDLAATRKNGFWSLQEPIFQLRWSLIENAAGILSESQRVQKGLTTVKNEPNGMIRKYTAEQEPWLLLDTRYRHMERQYATFDLELSDEHDALQQVIVKARQVYIQTINNCAEAFVAALQAADYQISEGIAQEAVFNRNILPALKAGKKTAYILVDSLRYEMGKELVEGLTEEFETELAPGIARLPTITPIGMAALMPGAENGISIDSTGKGKPVIRIGTVEASDRASRIKHFSSSVEAKVFACRLNELIKPSKKRREEINAADLILATSQEIDLWGESADSEDEVRIFMDEVLDKLRKGIRRLSSLGFSQIVVTADHGHIFGETMEAGLKMDPPGGKTVQLHSRVWIGKGGQAADGFVRVHANEIGLGGDFELAFPRGLACFKTTGGSRAYCHGGISLQEMVIPVISLKAKRTDQTFSTAKVELKLAKPKITNRFFSVTLKYVFAGLFGPKEIRVKLEVRAERKVVGQAAMAAKGFEEGTGEILLEKDAENPVTMVLAQTEGIDTVSIHVLDAATQVELGQLKKIPVEIVF